jgi:thymidylate synthase (FAD)
MGSDLSVVNAARVSFDKTSTWDSYSVHDQADEVLDPIYPTEDDYIKFKISQGWTFAGLNGPSHLYFTRLKSNDVGLINYLARGLRKSEWLDKINYIYDVGQQHTRDEIEETVLQLMDMAKHWAPFSHPHISLRMSAPVPIRTQAFKHKVGFSESEESRRYISSTPVLFVPEYFREKAENVKQGSGGKIVSSDDWLTVYTLHCQRAIQLYEDMLEGGVCEEQARFILPQGCEVNWIWTGSLAAYARFFNQRYDHHAQKEVQDLADMVGKIIEPLFPVSWEALTRAKAKEAAKA